MGHLQTNQSSPVEPESVEILKGILPKRNKKLDRVVFRMVGVGPEGVAVIGKRCKRYKAVVENTIYTDFLPHLPVPSPAYYGMVEETNGKYCWIFLEDAGNVEYSQFNDEHRELIVQWLTLMHISATQVEVTDSLPGKGPDQYLERLLFVRKIILQDLPILPIDADSLLPLKIYPEPT